MRQDGPAVHSPLSWIPTGHCSNGMRAPSRSSRDALLTQAPRGTLPKTGPSPCKALPHWPSIRSSAHDWQVEGRERPQSLHLVSGFCSPAPTPAPELSRPPCRPKKRYAFRGVAPEAGPKYVPFAAFSGLKWPKKGTTAIQSRNPLLFKLSGCLKMGRPQPVAHGGRMKYLFYLFKYPYTSKSSP